MSDEKVHKTLRQKAGHYEILGETYAQFEFFEQGWNPYSRFLDVDKVDFILRQRLDLRVTYREVQVKYGKLYRCGPKWEREHFDVTSWRFFPHDAFHSFAGRSDFFICFVFAEDIGYRGDIFLFPIDDFIGLLKSAFGAERKTLLISRSAQDPSRWYMRRKSRFSELTTETVADVSRYRRAFDLLQSNDGGGKQDLTLDAHRQTIVPHTAKKLPKG